jgi:hypothetical protein
MLAPTANVASSPARIRLRRSYLDLRLRLRRPTSALMGLPGFLIIGTQRGGTTSLYQYLSRHPDVRQPLNKEIHYFSNHYAKGLGWYRSHFPLVSGQVNRGKVTFEATPYYMLHPHSARRAKEVLPDARVVAILRDPVERAFSHYRHTRLRGLEPLGFGDAVRAEDERLAEVTRQLQVDEHFVSREHQVFSYLARGRYAEQLPRWFERFGPERVMVVRSEDLYEDAPATMRQVVGFLGLRETDLGEFPRYTERHRDPESMPSDVRARLSEYFWPHNERLYELLGRDMQWQ